MRCVECGQPIPSDAPAGDCPGCLLSLALFRFEPGGTLGPYVLLDRIGQGAMGVVYRARDPRLERDVALKTIRAGRFASELEVRRFRAEARAAAALKHPHIVPIYEVGEEDGRHFLAMELVVGESLSTLGAVGPERAARYARQLAEAMQYAHEQGVLHRDLKPSNVLVDGDDRARVIDFGLAKLLASDASLTATGQALGTPNYMAPEQARGESTGTAADVYAIGAVLYELLTGVPPFSAGSPLATLKLMLEQEPVPPRTLAPAVPRDLELICLRCLAKDPARRYASAGELAAELQRFGSGAAIRTRPVREPGKWVLGHAPWLAAYAAAMALGLVVRAQLLEANDYSARHVASSIQLSFRDWAEPLIAAAQSEPLRRALSEREPALAAATLAALRAKQGSAQSLLLMDVKCRGLARDPVQPTFDGLDLSPRDYCSGTHDTADGFYVARVHYSQYDRLLRHALSVLVHDSAGAPLGVLTSTLAAEAFDDKVTLVAPWDGRRRPGDPLVFAPGTQWVVVLHPGYQHADPDAVAFDGAPEPGSRLYFDPMARRSWRWAGPWLAGFAPVGTTGYFAVVQTRDGVGLGLVALTIAFVGLLVRRRRR